MLGGSGFVVAVACYENTGNENPGGDRFSAAGRGGWGWGWGQVGKDKNDFESDTTSSLHRGSGRQGRGWGWGQG